MSYILQPDTKKIILVLVSFLKSSPNDIVSSALVLIVMRIDELMFWLLCVGIVGQEKHMDCTHGEAKYKQKIYTRWNVLLNEMLFMKESYTWYLSPNVFYDVFCILYHTLLVTRILVCLYVKCVSCKELSTAEFCVHVNIITLSRDVIYDQTLNTCNH